MSAEGASCDARQKLAAEINKKFGGLEVNTPHDGRLQAFYQSASSILGRKGDSSVVVLVANGAADILASRGKAQEIYDRYLKKSGNQIISDGVEFLSGDNTAEDLKELKRIATAVDREAAALESLARNVQVTG